MTQSNRISRPVFIIGSPRSGTSALTWALGQHPNLLPLEESSWLSKFALDLASTYARGVRPNATSQLSSMRIEREDFFEFFGDAINDLMVSHSRHGSEFAADVDESTPFLRYRSPTDPKERWVDGTPAYSFFVHDLLELFPQARFIHLLRDVRLVVRSLMHFDSAGANAYTENFAYEEWFRYVKAANNAERAFGSDTVMRLRHADLLAEPEESLRRCLTFLGEDFCADCLKPLGKVINTSSPGFSAQDDDAPAGNGPVPSASLRGQAIELSDQLLSEPDPQYPADQEMRGELQARALADRGAQHRLPLVGPVNREGRVAGFCDDYWIDGELRATVRAKEPIDKLIIEGDLPDPGDGREITLFLTIDGESAEATYRSGTFFSWTVPCSIERHQRVELTLSSSSPWRPSRSRPSNDRRDLVAQVTRMVFSTAKDTEDSAPDGSDGGGYGYAPDEDLEAELEAQVAANRGSQRLPLVGPVTREGWVVGFCDDLWVDQELRATIKANERIDKLIIEGDMPDPGDGREMTLFLTLDGEEARATYPGGTFFSWTAPCDIAPNEIAEVTLTSSNPWRPSLSGFSDDRRDLVAQVRRMVFATAKDSEGSTAPAAVREEA